MDGVPLGNRLKVVAARPLLLEAGDVEPAGCAVVAGARAAGDSVAEDLVAGAGGLELRGAGEVTHDGDSGHRAGSRRAEGPRRGADGRGAGSGAEECRHCCCCGAGWDLCGCGMGMLVLRRGVLKL
jgi:hypothetical protein